MKKLLTIIAVALVSLQLTGCNGTYRAATIGTQTVNVAIGAWSDYVDTGKPTVEQRKAVLHAIEIYRQSLVTANAAVQEWFVQQGNGAKFPEAELRALQASSVELIKLINAVKGGK